MTQENLTSGEQPLLLDLLNTAGTEIRIFDLGRRVSQLSTDQFKLIEQAQMHYPAPYMHLAFVGILIWNPANRSENAVWFLKLPLDEQGFLVQAARDDLVSRLVTNVVNHKSGEPLPEDALKDNPFAYKPEQEKMAMFHSQAAIEMQQHASQYFEFAQQYFDGQLDAERWPDLALQGIADYAARLPSMAQSQARLLANLPNIPDAPLANLCAQLEHIALPDPLAQALALRLQAQLNSDQGSALQTAALLRGVSNTRDENLKQTLVRDILLSRFGQDAEILVTIATRCTTAFYALDILSLFLEKLATSDAGQNGFSRIIAELMFMPTLRTLILQAFRDPNRSDALTCAVGAMFGKHFG